MVCVRCKAVISNTSKFCPKCGDKVELCLSEKVGGMVKCPQCGTENAATAKFCKVDGIPLPQAATILEIEPEKPEAEMTEDQLEATTKDESTPDQTPQIPMIKCLQCGTENVATAKFCKVDGIPLPQAATILEIEPEKPEAEMTEDQPETTTKEEEEKIQEPISTDSLSSFTLAKGSHSKKWLWGTLISVIVIACGAMGIFYYFGYIGMTPLKIQKFINSDLKAKGLLATVIIDDEGVARIEGTVNDENEKQTALNIVKSNKYIKNVVDDTQLTSTTGGTEKVAASHVTIPATPDAVKRDVNKMLKKNRLSTVYVEVTQNMNGSLKGHVYSVVDKQKALQIARAHKKLKYVADYVEVRSVAPRPSPSGDPEKMEGKINKALRNAGIIGIKVEVKDDMSVVLKGSVRTDDERQNAIRITRRSGRVKDIKDIIFVVGS